VGDVASIEDACRQQAVAAGSVTRRFAGLSLDARRVMWRVQAEAMLAGEPFQVQVMSYDVFRERVREY
jgi:hypothetical protein